LVGFSHFIEENCNPVLVLVFFSDKWISLLSREIPCIVNCGGNEDGLPKGTCIRLLPGLWSLSHEERLQQLRL